MRAEKTAAYRAIAFFFWLSALFAASHSELLWQSRFEANSSFYKISGDQRSSPYPFDSFQSFSTLSFTLSTPSARARDLKLTYTGTFNDSLYRSQDQGFRTDAARFSLVERKGTPYRIDAGDFYAFFSQRTVQRSMKGVQVEVQPVWGGHPSFLAFFGTSLPDWNKLKPADDLSFGLSYLFQNQALGLLTFQVVRNRKKETVSNQERRSHFFVSSLAHKKELQKLKLSMDTELAWLTGRGLSRGKFFDNASDTSLFFQLQGKSSLPLSYQLQFERTGEAFINHLANITPDRRKLSGELNWRFRDNTRLSTSWQLTRDQLESKNPLDTNILRLSASGPFLQAFVNGVMTDFSFAWQKQKDKTGAADAITRTFQLGLAKEIGRNWKTNTQLLFQNLSFGLTTKQAQFSFSHPFSLYAFSGKVSPGLLIRATDGTVTGTDTKPGLSLLLSRENASLLLQAGYLLQHRKEGVDVNTWTGSFTLRFQQKQGSYGLSGDFIARSQSGGAETESFAVEAFYQTSLGL